MINGGREMGEEVDETVDVTVFGYSCSLKAKGNSDLILKATHLVDRKMRELSGLNSFVSPVKLAILVAINFAYGRNNVDTKLTSLSEDSLVRLSNLSSLLDKELE